MNTHYLRRASMLLPAAIACFALAGCAPKPPACDDAAVVQSIHQLVMGQVADAMKLEKSVGRNELARGFQDHLSLFIFLHSSDRERIPGLHKPALARYTEGASTSLSAVATDGYDSQARRHQCKATIKLKSQATGQTFEARGVPYTVQATAKAGEFMVESSGLEGLVTVAGKDAIDYVVAAIAKGLTAQRQASTPTKPPADGARSDEDHGD